MPKVIISLEQIVKTERKIKKVRTLIGRGTNSDIRLDDPSASGKHAEIVTVGNDSFVHDLGSTNGTYVNNLLTKRCALNDGDMIGIGNHVITFHSDRFSDTVPDFEKTMVIQTDMQQHVQQLGAEMSAIAKAEASEMAEGIPDAGADMPVARLEVVNGEFRGRHMDLRKPVVTLGRPGIQAAVISRRTNGYFITHVAGAGGEQSYPLVNGAPTGPRAHALNDKDLIELAGVRMEFRVS